jgi:hypothetical protein
MLTSPHIRSLIRVAAIGAAVLFTTPAVSQREALRPNLELVEQVDPTLAAEIWTKLSFLDSHLDAEASNNENEYSNDGSLSEVQSHAAALVGALMEFALAKDFGVYDRDHIKGSELLVGGKKHADFWITDSDQSEHMVVSGFVEIKSSLGGYINRGRFQIYGFLERLVHPNRTITIKGKKVIRERIRIRMADGRLMDLSELKTWFDSLPTDAAELVNEFEHRFTSVFGNNFYQVLVPKDDTRSLNDAPFL